MARRQKRIDPKSLLSPGDQYRNQFLTFVTRDKKSILAQIEKVEGNVFKLRNTMRHKINLDLRDVHEIWIDEKA